MHSYTQIKGTALIVAILPLPRQLQVQRIECVDVIFDFMPNNLQAKYRFPEWPDKGLRLFIKSETVPLYPWPNPPRRWVDEQRLTVGSVHRCSREEALESRLSCGAEILVSYRFPDLDYEKAIQMLGVPNPLPLWDFERSASGK